MFDVDLHTKTSIESLLNSYESFEVAFAQPDENNPFSFKMYGMEKYVISSSLEQTGLNKTEIITDDIVDTIRSSKATEGKGILVNGSGTIEQFLLQNNLVDEIQLLMNPTIMGNGRQLFTYFGERKNMELLHVQRFASGILALRYRVHAGE